MIINFTRINLSLEPIKSFRGCPDFVYEPDYNWWIYGTTQ